MAQAMAFFCVYFKELNCYGFFRKEEEGEKGELFRQELIGVKL
jgi:hypothetical protein